MKGKKYKKPYRKTRIFLSVMLAFLVFLALCDGVCLYGAATCDNIARTLPPYPRVDITGILQRDRSTWTEEDYNVLERQTGLLLKEAVDDVAEADGNNALLDFQNAFFFEGERRHDPVLQYVVYHDYLYDPEAKEVYTAPIAKLEPGDVLVSTTSHTVGWNNGHAALVLTENRLLQSIMVGTDSTISSGSSANGVVYFRRSTNFMVLRLKDADAAKRLEIANAAEKNLVGIPYHFTAGVFTPKDQGEHPVDTFCSHLVWQAFKNFGYDIDGDGGPVCTPRDISLSDCFDVVQVYGFDPDKLW